ncbi:cupredoxin domain-containing protein [Microcella sp.]|uniref:cupredoxin domain-containing protein n=1 Tax=Microcella sp. TaxID=1913979 RepID=UPI002562A027|nr:plastocyanin/azurin family copper-binding protein [Microcella sp.]MBX9472562.1 HcpC [Microcella sp.]
MSPTARITRSGLALVALPALLAVLVGCTGVTPGAPDEPMSASEAAVEAGPNEVVTLSLRFMPEDITVPVGTTVTWRNGETIGHTITSGAWGDVNESTGLRGSQTADGLFDHALAPMGQEGDTFSFTFDEPGEYLYFCQPHLTMNARVIVEG